MIQSRGQIKIISILVALITFIVVDIVIVYQRLSQSKETSTEQSEEPTPPSENKIGTPPTATKSSQAPEKTTSPTSPILKPAQPPGPIPTPTATPTDEPSSEPSPAPVPPPTPTSTSTPSLGQPDLVISSFSLNRSSYTPGETATATISVTNLGQSDSSAFNTHLYSNTNSNPGCSAPGGIDHWTPYSFSPSSSDSWSVSFQVPVSQGTYAARMFVDMACTITESNEGNNYANVSYTVSAPTTFSSPPAISVSVLVLKYFPAENGDGNLDPEITGMNDSLVSIRTKVNQLTTDIVNSLGSASTYHGYKDAAATPSLQYSVIEDKEFLKPKPISTNAIPWDPGVFRPDYNLILTTDVSICNYVDNLGVREVWIWGYHFGNINPVESNMAMGTTSQVQWNHGTYGDVSNSEQIDDLPTCTQSYTLYNYNYARGLAEALENHGHHIESIFRFVDATLWNKFQLPYGEPSPTVNSCGWTHTGPNSKEEYDPGWTSETIVKSNCEDWRPDGSGEVKDVSCHTWYGTTCLANGGVEFKKWWMQNIPGKNNVLTYLGSQMRDWWEFIGDFDGALSKGKSLTF